MKNKFKSIDLNNKNIIIVEMVIGKIARIHLDAIKFHHMEFDTI